MTFKVNYSLLGGNEKFKTYYIQNGGHSLKDLFK